MKRAVILLSGGLDSATTLAVALEKGCDIYPLTLRYGQRSEKEVDCARRLCSHYGLDERQKVMDLDLKAIGGSALLDQDEEVPLDREKEGNIPATYVPARNTIFLSIAAAYAEVMEAGRIFIGANAVDYSGYPDCRPEFIKAMEEAVNLGTKTGAQGGRIRISTPIIDMSKREIVRRGLELGVPYELTWSCYLGGDRACGRCDSCRLRLKGFKEAGAEDPLEYEQ